MAREGCLNLIDKKESYKHSQQLINDLEFLKVELKNHGVSSLANFSVNHSIQIVKTFGFHLAELDIRQNSSYYEKALIQIVNESKLNGKLPEELPEKEIQKIIQSELKTNRPFIRDWSQLPHEAKSVLNCFDVLQQHITEYSSQSLGSLIVSMTRNATDLMMVYILAREAGLTFFEETLIIKLNVAPLFETISDLIASPAIMEEYFSLS